MKATFILAAMVASAFWSTLGRSAELNAIDQKPKECITLATLAKAIIHNDYELPKLSVDISVDALCDQIESLNSNVDFLSSVSLAMESFLNDPSDIDSPLGIANFLAFDDLGIEYTHPVPGLVKARAQEILLSLLNRPSTKIELLTRAETPEGGESVDDNWILHLTIKDLSDHSFWSIIHRSGKVSVYNYGFN